MRLRIFIDVGLVEIYVDDGRWRATKRIDSNEPGGRAPQSAPVWPTPARA